MIEIYEILFNRLNHSQVRYCVYKGLNHLDEDLNGLRGDIDILVHPEDYVGFKKILRDIGYKKGKSFGFSEYFVALDMTTKRLSLLDVVKKYPVGIKPYKYRALDVNEIFNCLSEENDFTQPRLLTDKQCRIIKGKLEKSENSKYVDVNYIEENKTIKFFSCVKNIHKAFVRAKKTLGIPFYRVRHKGRLFALVGVDGAGKTSIVDRINSNTYFNVTGAKSIYFGNNDYWIPGLNRLAKMKFPRWGERALSILTRVDRQCRIVIAIYYINVGRDVIADRYYYDDLISKEQNLVKNNSLRGVATNYIKKACSVKMLKIPDMTFFLDVSPEVSYSRKKDYSYEKLISNITLYRDFMYNREEVTVINADDKMDDVYDNIIKNIYRE